MYVRLRVTAFLAVFACVFAVSCSNPEDPARAAMRDRLLEQEPLMAEELDRFRAEVTRAMGDQTFVIQENGRTLDAEQRQTVFGMLTLPAGVFDEGLRDESGEHFRVLNGPAVSPSSEIDTARRLWIDVETLLPRRFEYTYGFPHPENYTYTLVTE